MPAEITGSSIPILKEGSPDYSSAGNNAPSYDAVIKIKPSETPKAEIFHKLKGDSLVSRLIREGEAKFGCELIFIGSFRREFFLHDMNYSDDNDTQIITWNASDVSQKLVFRPVIIALEDIDSFALSKNDQVNEFWVGAEILIPKLATLADAKERSPDVTTQSILRIQLQPSFANFEMDIKRAAVSGRSHFCISVGKSLHQLLNNKSKDNIDLRRSLLVNALTGAFSILMRDFCKDNDNERAEIDQCIVLSSLRAKLIELGVGSWEDSENFSPLHAATKFEKLTWASSSNSKEEDDD